MNIYKISDTKVIGSSDKPVSDMFRIDADKIRTIFEDYKSGKPDPLLMVAPMVYEFIVKTYEQFDEETRRWNWIKAQIDYKHKLITEGRDDVDVFVLTEKPSRNISIVNTFKKYMIEQHFDELIQTNKPIF